MRITGDPRRGYDLAVSFEDLELLCMGLHNQIAREDALIEEFYQKHGLTKDSPEVLAGETLDQQLFIPTKVAAQELLFKITNTLGYDPADG